MTYTPRKRDRQLQRRYGITQEDYAILLGVQHGRCGICREPATSGRALAVDHCHETGRVRGLLCDRCNTALGGFRDSANHLVAALAYMVRRNGDTR